jgi:hypothetical protein
MIKGHWVLTLIVQGMRLALKQTLISSKTFDIEVTFDIEEFAVPSIQCRKFSVIARYWNI